MTGFVMIGCGCDGFKAARRVLGCEPRTTYMKASDLM